MPSLINSRRDDDEVGPLKLGGRYKSSRMDQIRVTLNKINRTAEAVLNEEDTRKNALALLKASYWMAHLSSGIAEHVRLQPKEYPNERRHTS
jgi:hypothetical protein|nr:MAG TPA: hypothetical protein [Caudoviricetes sp.]